MYTVAVKKQFIAWHYLIGGNWGPENEKHSHRYCLEVSLEGPQLNEHGYLIDITIINCLLDDIVIRLQDRVLNDLPEFAGLNPSIEHLAGLCFQWMRDSLTNPPIAAICIKIFENEDAWASFRRIVK
jgi:6-pyruvoyltetrahydropterin/6-carboxytetrahydropterin synthase